MPLFANYYYLRSTQKYKKYVLNILFEIMESSLSIQLPQKSDRVKRHLI